MVVINPNTMAQEPIGISFHGTHMDLQPGESPRQWQQRQLANRQKPAPAPVVAPDCKAEQMRRNDAEIARLKQQLNSQPAVVPAADAKQRELQDAVGKSLREINDDLKQLKAEADGEKPKRKGFASKLRFGGGFHAFTGNKHTQRKES